LELEGMRTVSTKPHEVKRDWLIVDATNKVLGRVATEVASRLRGKHKPEFTPHVDTGDYVIITNVEKLRVTGNKESQKHYHAYSGYPGGLRSVSFAQMQAKHPARVLELAVKGMLPKNSLGRQMYRKLKIYVGSDHPHSAQQPIALQIEG